MDEEQDQLTRIWIKLDVVVKASGVLFVSIALAFYAIYGSAALVYFVRSCDLSGTLSRLRVDRAVDVPVSLVASWAALRTRM